MAIPGINSNILAEPLKPVPVAKTAPKPKPSAKDTVKISAAAKELQQRTEAPAQVIEAASSGDIQAKAQLARPATASVASK